MAKARLTNHTTLADNSNHYAVLRAQVSRHLQQLAEEQTRLREVLLLLSVQETREAQVIETALVPGPVKEQLPTPRRRSWSPEAREAQRKRMKAHWRKQKAASKR